MLIAGIGIANTLLSFINQNNMSIAVRKAVGFYSGNIKTLYYLQLFILLGIGVLAMLVIAIVVFIERGQRRITVNYAQRQQDEDKSERTR